MDIVPIILPPLASYITSTYCPFMPPQERIETQAEYIIRKNVWPVLSGTIGFAWYFARNKAALVKGTNKGTRKTVNKLGKLFQGSQKYVLDLAFMSLIAMINWWIYTHSCTKNHKNAFYVLIGTIATVMWVIYITASYTTYSLLLLTPLLVWLLFTAQYTIRQMYFNEFSAPLDEDESNVDVDVDVDVTIEDTLLPKIDDSEQNDPDKANQLLAAQEQESIEQFRIW